MKRISQEKTEAIIEQLKLLGQNHLLDQLELTSDHPIINQLSDLDLSASIKSFESAKATPVSSDRGISPVDKAIDWTATDSATKSRIESIGKDALKRGKVAAVIMSGGQGTRLGFAGPKGMYDMNLKSRRTIFQIHIDRIKRVRQMAAATADEGTGGPSGVSIPIYIMTSDLNDKIIRDYFTSVDYFGYPKEDIFFFQQGVEPCLTLDGKLIIESPKTLSLAPDGNGGIYRALKISGAIDDMIRRGTEHLHIYGIDNVLTKSLDPAFIGLCIENNIECGNKVVWRASKDEKVGVSAVTDDGRMCIVEYSEIPPHMAEAVDEGGKLIYGAANICNHYISLQFLTEKVLPNISGTYHLAVKKIPFMDPITKETVIPTQNNGVKLEMFIFDVFPLAERWLVMEVAREDEFAPVKNAPWDPTDSPATARRMMSDQAVRWLRAAGATVVIVAAADSGASSNSGSNSSAEDALCEVSPLLSYAGEGLEKYAGTLLKLPIYLE